MRVKSSNIASHVWKSATLCNALIFGIVGEAGAQTNIQNPIGSNDQTIPQLLAAIMSQLRPFALTLAVFSIVVVGFQFVYYAVAGNSSGVTSARKNLMWVLLGTAVILAASTLATIVENFLKGI